VATEQGSSRRTNRLADEDLSLISEGLKMNYPAASGRGINKENIFNIAASGGE
jgi:hypothetical protein